jgi:hypothetical protein
MEDLELDGRISGRISEGVVTGRERITQTGLLAEDREGTGCCERGHEPSGFTTRGECLDQLRNYQLRTPVYGSLKQRLTVASSTAVSGAQPTFS